MNTLKFAVAALKRLEVADIKDNQWWDSQTKEFKRQYLKVHPNSKYGNKKDKPKKQEKTKAPLNISAQKKSFKKLDPKSHDFNKDSSIAVKKLSQTAQSDVNPFHLHHVDEALANHSNTLSKKHKGISKTIDSLNKRLLKAPAHQHSSIKGELRSAEQYKNRIQKEMDKVNTKHKKLIEAHPSALRQKNAERQLQQKMKDVRAHIISERRDLVKLEKQKKEIMARAKAAKGQHKETYINQLATNKKRIQSTKERINSLKNLLSD